MRTRVILLGASNLTQSLPRVVTAGRALAGGPVEVRVAAGHGRSYGRPSRVLARTLPGIVECGLWRSLEGAEPTPTLALVTDIGNDIAYGVPARTILAWVGTCVERLAGPETRLVLTPPPLESLGRTGPVRFRTARALLFPRHSVAREGVLDDADRIAGGLEELAARHGADVVPLAADWYGIDPIHVRPSRRAQAWGRILAPWGTAAGHARPAARPTAAETRAVRRARAQERWVWGRRRTTPQPSARLPDGTPIRMY